MGLIDYMVIVVDYLVIVVGLLILLLIIVASVRAMKKGKASGNGGNLGSYFAGLRSGNFLRTMLLVIVYLFLLYMVRTLFPEIWYWMWAEKEVFWIIQGVVVSSVIIFSIGPRWSKILLFPILLLVLGIYVLEEVKIDTSPEIDQKSTVTEPAEEPTEAEIEGFLSNPSPPADLVVKKERGEIWDLRILYSGVVKRDEWTEVIELPVPPRRRYYRIEAEILSGSVEVMNRGRYVGRHPEEDLPLSRRPLRLQFRTEKLSQTAIVIWRWTQGSY